MLVVERAAGPEVDAVYAIGGGPDPDWKARVTHRKGRIVDGKLVFEEEGLSTLRYVPGPDGSLAAQWVAADRASSLEATLHRVN
jgi:hypothetical protein